MTISRLLLSLIITKIVLRHSVLACNTADTIRLSEGMEGRVEVCLNGIWSRVCGQFSNKERSVACKEMGHLLNSIQPSRTDFGEVGCETSLQMADVECLGFEDMLFKCSHQIVLIFPNSNCSCRSNAVVRCTEGVPPTELQLHPGRDTTSVRVTWNTPNKTRSNTERLVLHSYTVTCSTMDHSVQKRVSSDILTTTISGLQLAVIDYECCVAADFSNYHPKTCAQVDKQIVIEPVTTEGAPTEGDTMQKLNTSVEPPLITTPAVATTLLLIPSSSRAASTIAAAGVLGALVFLLLLTLCGCMACHCMRWTKVKPSRGTSSTSSATPHSCIHEIAEGKELDSHTYETVDWLSGKISTGTLPHSNDTHYQEERQSKEPVRGMYEQIETGCSVDMEEAQEAKGLTEWREHCTGDLSSYKVIEERVRDEKPWRQCPKPPEQQYVCRTVQHNSLFSPPPSDGANSGQILLECAVPPSSDTSQTTAAVVSGRYEFAELSDQVQSATKIEEEAPPWTLSGRYEFAGEQTSPLEGVDVYSSMGKLPTRNPSVRTKQTYYNIHPLPDLSCSDGHMIPDICTDGSDTKLYVNVPISSSHNTEDRVHHGYSQCDLLGNDSDWNNSYSHVNIAETDRNHIRSHPELKTDTSHSYSRINTMSGKLVSPGYFHLDTNKPDSGMEISPLHGENSRPASAQILATPSKGNGANGATVKGYSHLDIAQCEVVVVDTDTSVDEIGCSSDYCQMNGLGSPEELKQELLPETGRKAQVPRFTFEHSTPLLDDSDTNKLHHAKSTGYSSLSVESPKGYSQLDITKIQSDAEQTDGKHSSDNKGYSHLDIEKICTGSV